MLTVARRPPGSPPETHSPPRKQRHALPALLKTGGYGVRVSPKEDQVISARTLGARRHPQRGGLRVEDRTQLVAAGDDADPVLELVGAELHLGVLERARRHQAEAQ